MTPYKEKVSKKSDHTFSNIFDDKYKISKVSEAKKEKYAKTHLDGNLKSSVMFDDEFVF
jgi:hypothetical protein